MKLREKVPNRITPDGIKDSIVQLYVDTAVPYVPSIGYFFSYLVNLGYSYQDRNDIRIRDHKTGTIFTPASLSADHVFLSDDLKLKIQVSPGYLTFNCVDEYIGWSAYMRNISEIVEKFYSDHFVKRVSRIGVRYISEFRKNNIFDGLNLQLECPPFQDLDNIDRFALTKKHGEVTVVLNLSKFADEQPDFVNVIDVDVIQRNLSLTSESDVLSRLDELHDLEKCYFFSILSDEFLLSLNPEY